MALGLKEAPLGPAIADRGVEEGRHSGILCLRLRS